MGTSDETDTSDRTGADAPDDAQRGDGEAAAGGISVAVEEREAWKRRLTITVPQERVARARQRERDRLRRTVRLKGFRKGKVPPRLIEERYGPVIDERTVSRLVEDSYREALEDEELLPIGDPEFGDVRYRSGESLTFEVEFDVMPAIRLERVGGFRVERPEVELDEGEVEDVLERLRGEHAILEPVERRPEEGDVVSVRITRLGEAAGDGGTAEVADAGEEPAAASAEAATEAGTAGGTPAEGAAAEEGGRPYRFELGAGYAIPAVEEAIRTLEPGRAGEFDVTFPEDFDDDELRGATRRLRIDLVDVKARRLPDLDDAFASEVGDFDSIDALREAIREDVRDHHEEEAERTLRERLVDAIIEANPFDVPPALVESYLDQVIEAPEDADPAEVEAARRQLAPSAERRIKRHLILDRLVEREGFEATDEELEARLASAAEQRGVSPADLRRRLAGGDQLDSLRRQIAVDKAFEWLEGRSEIR